MTRSPFRTRRIVTASSSAGPSFTRNAGAPLGGDPWAGGEEDGPDGAVGSHGNHQLDGLLESLGRLIPEQAAEQEIEADGRHEAEEKVAAVADDPEDLEAKVREHGVLLSETVIDG